MQTTLFLPHANFVAHIIYPFQHPSACHNQTREVISKSLSEAFIYCLLGEKMASQHEREKLDAKARQGETVVPGGTGGKSLEAQEHLAEGIFLL